MNVFILRFGEIALKGANRSRFEKSLIRNIQRRVEGSVIKRVQGRFYLYNDKLDEDRIIVLLHSVFGLVSFSPAIECELDIEKIKETILSVIEKEKAKRKIETFRITTNRIEKHLLSSNEMSRDMGAFVIGKTGWKAKMKGMDLNIGIEIANKAFIYTEKIGSLAGIPVGIEGNIFLLMDDPDALVSGFIMMKRGCDIFPLIFDEKDREMAEGVIEKLQVFSPGKLSLHVYKPEEIKEVAEKYKLRAIAVSDKVDKMRPDLEITTLRPIVAFPDKTLKFYRDKIEKIILGIEK
ncbi:MAG: hypothetical protein KAT43_01815 [Nanoarchaeota archaeon]|nr:hypothetical protein [Nanoarchaeota archaeon]